MIRSMAFSSSRRMISRSCFYDRNLAESVKGGFTLRQARQKNRSLVSEVDHKSAYFSKKPVLNVVERG